jgi:hypothetical protein
MPGRCEGARQTITRPLDRGRALRPWYHPGSPPSHDSGLASRSGNDASNRDVARNNGGQPGDAYCAVSVRDARKTPRWDADTPAHAGAVGIAARRSCSNGLPAPPSHQSRLAEPAGSRLLVLVIAIGPCAGEEEQKTTTECGGGCSHRSSCGTFSRRNWHQAQSAGCRASKGRFPPPLWMSAGLDSVVEGDDSRRGGRMSRVLH